MATLKEIKDRIAIDKGFRNWNSLIPFTKAMYTDEVAKAYAKSACEKVREDFKETIDLWRINNEDQIGRDPVGMVDSLIKMLESKAIELP